MLLLETRKQCQEYTLKMGSIRMSNCNYTNTKYNVNSFDIVLLDIAKWVQ